MDAEVWDSEQDQIWNPQNITQQDMLDTASVLALFWEMVLLECYQTGGTAEQWGTFTP